MSLRFLLPAIFLLALLAPPPARADDPRPPTPAQQIRQLEYQNALLEMKLKTWTSRTDHLVRLVGSLLEKQDGEAAACERVRRALDVEIGVLRTASKAMQRRHAEVLRELREARDADRERWSEDLMRLAREHEAVQREARASVAHVAALENQTASLEEQKGDLTREVARLRYALQRGVPNGTVADALSSLPASHWRQELKHGDFPRRRMALIALRAIPDPDPTTVGLILEACAKENGLLDTARGALARVGAPAVAPLVEAADGGCVDRGWAIWVLQSLGAEAESALPWLEMVASDPDAGRDAKAAQGAIRKIRR